jgi:hypothetical protein
MREFTFSDKEFIYLGYFLFTIDGDDPEDWEFRKSKNFQRIS